MKFGFVGPSYTAKSNTVADEECINFYAETNETPGAQAQRSYFGTPGLKLFTAFPDSPVRRTIKINDRVFGFASDYFYELFDDGTYTARSPELIVVFGEYVSVAASSTQILVVAGGRAYCFTLADNSWLDVTDQLAGTPTQVAYSDGYFIVCFRTSNKFQISDILDGTNWPGLQVNEVSVFPENLAGIEVSHRELWVFGERHIQPYQDSGTDEIFDVIQGALIETGLGASFGKDLLDNTLFWVSEDERGARQCWRANGYTPARISTHAVEAALSSYADFDQLQSFTYQDNGHLFWVLYVPNTDCTWVYDVAEGLWHKRAEWHQEDGSWGPWRAWNHVYAWGKHLVGDWKTGNLYEMSLDVYNDQTGDDSATVPIRRLRRAPTLVDEMRRVYYAEMLVNLNTGQGPQPALTDGSGNPRAPQAMLRWSNDSGSTWSNEHWRPCGFSGEYGQFVRWQRLGQGRRRVFEFVVTDPIAWAISDAYLKAS